MIPRILHLWWHTPQVPDDVRDTYDRWHALHSYWRVHLWTNEPALSGAFSAANANETSTVPEDRIRHSANLVRWHLLADQGGVWVDTDTEPLCRLDRLLDTPTPFCGQITRTEPTVIGGPPRHPLFEMLATEAARPQPTCRAPVLSGSHLLHACTAHFTDIRVLEPGAFFDIDSDGSPIPEPTRTPRYCRHRWATSSQRRQP
jgi:mannosyltransferase OCH1-like enzyme